MTDVMERLRTSLAERYEVLASAGEGGMATVYRARDRKHQRDVAIKVLRAELAATIGTERFLREIEIAAKLQHPHILPVYDSGEADGILYYVMPFVEGESLKDRLDRGPLPATDALRISRDVSRALDYAHRHGVVHRDIKPANILLLEGLAVVADFGIARATADGGGLTQVGMAVGTPWYMSPEQATAEPTIDGRSDTYALGCVLYEMLEGRPPYEGKTAQAIIAQVVSAPVPVLERASDNLPQSVTRIISRCLAKDPDDRFSTADELAEDIDRCISEVTTGSMPAVRGRGRRVTAGLVIAAVAAVAVALGLSVRGAGSTVAPGAEMLAVMPFDVAGVTRELGEGMVNLVSTNLNAVGALQTVDARTVLQRWRTRGGSDGLDLQGALDVGRDVSAGSVLLGSVVAAGTGVRLHAEMYDIDGREMARVQVDGPADSVLMLVDSLSIGILRAIWNSSEPLPSFDVAAVTSGSLDAIRAYMRGAMYFRHAQWDSAAAAYNEAIAHDSTFALAYLELSETYGWTGNDRSRRQLDAIAGAARHIQRLPPRERLLVRGHDLHRRGDRRGIDTLRLYTERYPNDPRGWYALGDAQYHTVSMILSLEEKIEPFDRAIALDSGMAVALVHPSEIALMMGDQQRFERYRRAMREAGGTNDRGPIISKALWGTPTERRDAFQQLVTLQDFQSIQVALGSALTGGTAAIDDALFALAGAIDTMPVDAPGLAVGIRYTAGAAALAAGRLDNFDRLTEDMEASPLPFVRALGGVQRILAVLGGIRPGESANAALKYFEGESADSNGLRFVQMLVKLADGDTSGVAWFTDFTDDPEPDRRQGARGIVGWAAAIQGDTARAIPLLRSASDSMDVENLGPEQFSNVFRLQLGRLLAARPDTRDEGLRILRHGFPVQRAPEMLPASYLALGQALEAAGDLDGAAAAYSDLITLWQDASAELQPRVESVRAALERVTAQRR